MHKLKHLSIFLFLLYLILCLLLDEFHPFSRYPMYSSFPDYSYVFYLSSEEKLVPFNGNFRMKANDVSHLYVAVCEKHNFLHGSGLESDSQLTVVGKEMFEQILETKIGNLSQDSLAIHREHYFYKDGKIQKNDKILYTGDIE